VRAWTLKTRQKWRGCADLTSAVCYHCLIACVLACPQTDNGAFAAAYAECLVRPASLC
jgi:hypothetical protein